MQTLDVISVNLWQILISLCNLTLLFLIVKKFLFKPVLRTLENRQKELDEKYAAAENAREEAEEFRKAEEEKLSSADLRADTILQNAVTKAKKCEEKILEDAKNAADNMIRTAENEVRLERKKGTEQIREEIASVSVLLAEKMLEREVNAEDHHTLISSFLDKIGEGDD